MPNRSLQQYESFTAAAAGSTKNLAIEPGRSYALQVKGHSAAATAWNVVLEGSLDGTNFFVLATHANTTPQTDGDLVFAVDKPCSYARARCVSVTLGGAGSLDVNWLAVP